MTKRERVARAIYEALEGFSYTQYLDWGAPYEHERYLKVADAAIAAMEDEDE